MKFDFKQPYGIITGHSWARYEQNGVLFDALGHEPFSDEIVIEDDPYKESEVAPVINNHQKDFALDNAQAFLKNVLAEGPISRSSIFKEASNNNQNWEKVKTAFADLGGEVFTRKNIIHWKLKAE